MDPNATWAEILRAYRDDDEEACREACQNLLAWLRKAGFPPRISGIPDLDRIMVQAVCTDYLTRVPKGEQT